MRSLSTRQSERRWQILPRRRWRMKRFNRPRCREAGTFERTDENAINMRVVTLPSRTSSFREIRFASYTPKTTRTCFYPGGKHAVVGCDRFEPPIHASSLMESRARSVASSAVYASK
jgi:hypothetical protein